MMADRDKLSEYVDTNRRNWDERAPVHARSECYDLECVRQGNLTLLSLEREELGDVRGKDLLHLMCHIGTDTVGWARVGARVTGVDQSSVSLAVASQLASECGVEVDFIESNVMNLPETLHGRFDIVVATYGITCWLPDMDVFCQEVANCLRPGGKFLLIDDHPMREVFLWDETGDLRPVQSYFRTGNVEVCPPGPSYADPNVHIPVETYQWSHTIGEIVTAVSHSGLCVEALREYPFTHWNCGLPDMFQDADGWWRLPHDTIPLMFLLSARR